jgi:CHAD domain-containing protein
MPSYTEIERKYDVAPHIVTPALNVLAGVATVGQPVQHDLVATYYDTADLALAHARTTLRRRTGGDDEGWHLKLPRDDGREEIREPLGDDVPAALLDRVRAHVGDHEIVPIARIRTRRLSRHLFDDGGNVLAEFCDDDVKASRLHPDTEDISWREWELEIVDGSPDLLDRAEELIVSAGASVATGPSKLLRVLGPAAEPARRTPPAADATTGEALLAYLRSMVDLLAQHDPLVRQDAEDAVHQMRVASRRLRSVLATYRPILDREQTDPVRDELRWLSGELGLARDSEVMLERLHALVVEQPAELTLGPVAQRLDAHLGERYREGRRHAEDALNSDRYYRLLDTLAELLDRPPFTGSADTSAAKLLPKLLNRDWKRSRKRISSVDEADSADARDHALHEVRKAAKRLRYGADSAEPVLGARASELSSMAEDVQDVLGEHQDTIMSRPVLRTLGVQAHLAGENGFTFGRLHALEEARAEQLRGRYEEVLTVFPDQKVKAWLRG